MCEKATIKYIFDFNEKIISLYQMGRPKKAVAMTRAKDQAAYVQWKKAAIGKKGVKYEAERMRRSRKFVCLWD